MNADSHNHDAEQPSPSIPAPGPSGLAPALERNIRALVERREQEAAALPREERVAAAITRFTGSMSFVYIHLAAFGFWIIANIGIVPGVTPWDPSMVVLAMVASVEAIFLSTFVLISQNRMAASADKRADLDLQINLLTEHEVTRLVALVSALTEKFDVRTEADAEIHELKRTVAPEAVLDRIEASAEATAGTSATSPHPHPPTRAPPSPAPYPRRRRPAARHRADLPPILPVRSPQARLRCRRGGRRCPRSRRKAAAARH